MEKNWSTNLSEDETIKLAIKALLEVVDSGSKNMEVAVIRLDKPLEIISEQTLQKLISDIEREQEEAKKSNNNNPQETPMET